MTAPSNVEPSGSARAEPTEPNLFIGWGGEWSKRVARALYDWLPEMIDAVRPWTSDQSLRGGSEWFSELKIQLSRVDAAIFCLTPDNLQNPWIHFEAGAIVNRGFQQGRVMVYMIGLETKDLEPPFSFFQGRIAAEEEQTFKLLQDLNGVVRANLPSERLVTRFANENGWRKLKGILDGARPSSIDAREPRGTESMFEELLGLVRSVDAGVSRALEMSEQALWLSQGLLPPVLQPSGLQGSQGPTGPAGPTGPLTTMFGRPIKVTPETEASVRLNRPRLADSINEALRLAREASKSEGDKE